jgi:hypothetical protein
MQGLQEAKNGFDFHKVLLAIRFFFMENKKKLTVSQLFR